MNAINRRSIPAILWCGALALLLGTPAHAAGTAPLAFDDLGDVAVDGHGNIYVSNRGTHSIRKIAADGMMTTVARGLNSACGLASDSAGNLYVTDYRTNTLSRIDPSGAMTALTTSLNEPCGVAIDGAGNLYVADGDSVIRKITADGTDTILAGKPGEQGAADGVGGAARFKSPRGLAVDRAGNVYVSDRGNNTIRKITPDGRVTTLAGSAGKAGDADGRGAAAQFNLPVGLAIDGAGNLYVADYDNNTIRKVTPAGVVSTLAGKPGTSGYADRTGAAARFIGPIGIAADSAGNVFVADHDNGLIRKITPGGAVTTVSGTMTEPQETPDDDDAPGD